MAADVINCGLARGTAETVGPCNVNIGHLSHSRRWPHLAKIHIQALNLLINIIRHETTFPQAVSFQPAFYESQQPSSTIGWVKISGHVQPSKKNHVLFMSRFLFFLKIDINLRRHGWFNALNSYCILKEHLRFVGLNF